MTADSQKRLATASEGLRELSTVLGNSAPDLKLNQDAALQAISAARAVDRVLEDEVGLGEAGCTHPNAVDASGGGGKKRIYCPDGCGTVELTAGGKK